MLDHPTEEHDGPEEDLDSVANSVANSTSYRIYNEK
jgi:hypothetical protein